MIELKNMIYITGHVSCMPLIVAVNTMAECPRTDCDIYWEGKKNFRLSNQHLEEVLNCLTFHVFCPSRRPNNEW